MVPPADLLPDVLPTARLNAGGRPTGALRDELRRVPSVRNALTVLAALAQSFGAVVAAAWIGEWWIWPVAFVLVSRGFVLLSILAHEAAHRLLFANRRLNDLVGAWLLAYPALLPITVYRRAHMAHHREEFGPDEPDLALYRGYPISRASLARKLRRDALFVSGWKNLRPLLRAVRRGQPEALAVGGVQVVLAATGIVLGHPWLYPLLWLAPWMTGWRVLNRLRAIAEHGGMVRSRDRRLTTHVVRQRRLARFWLVPYRTGWHLAHHVDSGVPFRSLPRLHAELAAAGWIPPGLEHRSYVALWRSLSAGDDGRRTGAEVTGAS
jgi:fatty acid desaturase